MYNLFAEAHKAKASSHLHFSPTNKALSIPSPSTGEGAGGRSLTYADNPSYNVNRDIPFSQ